MERLGNTRPSGLHAGNLRAWGMLFVVAGIIGRSILQNQMLGVGVLIHHCYHCADPAGC